MSRENPLGDYLLDTYELDPNVIRDISSEVLGDDGRLRILSSAFWKTTTPPERALFGHRYGIYGFPTMELVEYLNRLIGRRRAIEIGAGSGVLAEALGIPATDSRCQEKEPWRSVYGAARLPIVRYGANVEDCNANRAVRKYKPDVVIGCWVAHKFDPRRPQAEGFEDGIDEEDILRHCGRYIIVGNARVHRGKKIWGRPHLIEYPSFVFSRARYPHDFVAVWRGRRAG